jgi:hypothetical protein
MRMIFTNALALVCSAALMLAESASAQPTLEPIPLAWLHGRRLVAKDWNFSIDSPSHNSQWSYMRDSATKSTMFVVGTAFDLMVWDSGVNPSASKVFVDKLRQVLSEEGRLDDTKTEPSDFPLKNSAKLQIAIHHSDDHMTYMHSYVFVGERTYMFTTYSSEASEPLQFRRFVGSFKLLSSSPTLHSCHHLDPHAAHQMCVSGMGLYRRSPV